MNLIQSKREITKESIENAAIDIVAVYMDRIDKETIQELNVLFPIQVVEKEDRNIYYREFVVLSPEQLQRTYLGKKHQEFQDEINRLEEIRSQAVKDQDFNHASSIRAMIEGLSKAKQILLK